MIGSIIGDIVGSTREFHYEKDNCRDWPLILETSQITDDSILTLATSHSLLNSNNFNESYYRFAMDNPQPLGGYGAMFVDWLYKRTKRLPYDSYGNGSAMRASPIGWFSDDEDEVLELAKKSAEITHSHPEGIKGAQVVAWSILKLRKGMPKDVLKNEIEKKFNYDLNFNLMDLNKNYQFEPSCQKSVPQAIFCFLESSSFEETLRNVLFIGGDTDTIGAIAGGIAEAFYKIPNKMIEIAEKKMYQKNPCLLEYYNEYNKIKLKTQVRDIGVSRYFIRTLSVGELLKIKYKKEDLLISFINHWDNNPIDDINKSPIVEDIEVFNQLLIYADDVSYEHILNKNFIEKLFKKNKNPFHFTDKNAIDIINKVKGENIKNIYINCEYGKSRSVSTAIFINNYILENHVLLTPDKIIRNKFIYNKLKKIFKNK
jgi:ADP-ribosyl-[dinitrogen reductase] hydrolase